MMLVFKLRANLLILPIIYTYLRNRILLSLRQQLIVEVFFSSQNICYLLSK